MFRRFSDAVATRR